MVDKSQQKILCALFGFFALVFFSPNAVHAQTNQTTVTDIENNPIAQDILEKIEETKRWIAELEQRQKGLLSQNLELEEKRKETQLSLQRDLKQWENLWSQYSSENVFAKFVDKIPTNATKQVFWNHYDFTQAKIKAGHEAYDEVINKGGEFQEAYAAYLKAAEIKKIEMIQVNSMYNVMHGLAYYNQQILFNPNGQFDLQLSGEQLRKYYKDYRTNPQYLLSNSDDNLSWDGLAKKNSEFECRIGYTLVQRHSTHDYVCITDQTAEMWKRHGIGTAVDKEVSLIPDNIDLEQMNKDRIVKKIVSVNSKIEKMDETYERKSNEMNQKYNFRITQIEFEQKEEEDKILRKITNDEISTQNFNDQMNDVREKYDELEKTVIQEKFQVLEILEKAHKQEMKTLIEKYDEDVELRITWDPIRDRFQAIIEK